MTSADASTDTAKATPMAATNTAADTAESTQATARDAATEATARDTTSDATAGQTTADGTTTDTTADSTANSTTSDATAFLLGLVFDEVYFGFGGLSGSGSGDGDVGLFVGFLDQHVDEGLLFVLSLSGDDGRDGCGRCWGLNEDDLVVLLGDSSTGDNLWALFFGFWGWDVDVDVFLDDGSASEASSDSATSESTTDGATSDRTTAESTANSTTG